MSKQLRPARDPIEVGNMTLETTIDAPLYVLCGNIIDPARLTYEM